MKGDSSQKFVPIKTIHEGVIELDNGSFVEILITNSLNLALKSQDEQAAIVAQFQNFFNSLDFPIQIFAKSRRANIDGYIASLQDRLKYIDEELLKLQTVEYINYIQNFVSEVNIMEKQFFVVVPYTPAITGNKSVASSPLSLFGATPKLSSIDNQTNLLKVRQQLEERVSVVSSGLSRCGLRLKQLDTEEAMELFYELFNPGIESKAII
ncbi:MAG: hypothetical protein QG614_50 [Patescibacteria group bacterium]|nr:hypothetical protein [Patescibacteria group bacterium]